MEEMSKKAWVWEKLEYYLGTLWDCLLMSK